MIRSMEVESMAKTAVGQPEVNPPSPLDELKLRRSRLLAQMDDVNNAIKALENHPEIEQVLTLLQKAGRW
jgi:hypothetical protein